MKNYKIKRTKDNTMVISTGRGEHVAEYKMTPGSEKKEIIRMRYIINKHLAAGGTMGNYQW